MMKDITVLRLVLALAFVGGVGVGSLGTLKFQEPASISSLSKVFTERRLSEPTRAEVTRAAIMGYRPLGM